MKQKKKSVKINKLDKLTDEQKAMFNPNYLENFVPKVEVHTDSGNVEIKNLGINAAYLRGESPVTNRNNSI